MYLFFFGTESLAVENGSPLSDPLYKTISMDEAERTDIILEICTYKVEPPSHACCWFMFTRWILLWLYSPKIHQVLNQLSYRLGWPILKQYLTDHLHECKLMCFGVYLEICAAKHCLAGVFTAHHCTTGCWPVETMELGVQAQKSNVSHGLLLLFVYFWVDTWLLIIMMCCYSLMWTDTLL